MDRIDMMRGKPFLQPVKGDDRSELLRRLAIALTAKPIAHNLAEAEKPEAPKSTPQE
jgi:hypothetical protein